MIALGICQPTFSAMPLAYKLFNYPTSQTALKGWLLYKPSHKEGTKLPKWWSNSYKLFSASLVTMEGHYLRLESVGPNCRQIVFWCFAVEGKPLDSFIALPFLCMGAL